MEFALLLPFLLAILLGIMEFGWMFYTDLQITNAARDGARKGAVSPAGAVEATAEARVNQVLDLQGSGMSSDNAVVSAICDDAEESIRVRVDYQYQALTPLASLPFIPTVILPKTLQSEAVMHLDTGEGCVP